MPVLSCLVVAVCAAPAHAGFFTAEPIDGPDANIRSLGDVDVARDGSGGLVYVKRDGGVDHVFASRFVSGVWQPPERIDAGLDGAGAQPVIAASDGGRLTAAFISGGSLFAIVRPSGAPAWGTPQLLATSASSPSVDMSINGAAYISFTQSGDVKVARMDRTQVMYTVLPDILDINPTDDSGSGSGRSDVAVSADGTAVVLWGEANHVFARRVFFDHLSVAPQDLNVPSVDGHAGGNADMPTIAIEDDSSFAWATIREQMDDGKYHTIAERLVGSDFEQDTKVDGLDYGSGDQSTGDFVAISGKGEGIALTSTQGNTAQASIIHDDKPFPAVNLASGGAVQPHTVGGVAENNDAFAFWLNGGLTDATVHGAFYDIDPGKRTVPPPGPDTLLSDAGQGAVDANAGFDAAVNRAGDAVAVFIQDGGPGRRLMVAGYDRPPGAFRTYTSANYHAAAHPTLSWQAAFDLWGPITYDVQVDGQSYGTTTETRLIPPTAIPDGVHKWKVVATDHRGQTKSAPTRILRVDATPPEAAIAVSGTRKAGKPVTVTATVADGSIAQPVGSGVKSVAIAFGDGAVANTRTAAHRYAKGGTYTITVTATDKAGNTGTATRVVTIAKAKKKKGKK